jgi:hypothetical protein
MHQLYPVREDLKKALPGPYFQVLVALSHIFEALAQKKKFNVMLELAGVGALDDVVLEYFDNNRANIISRNYLQLKHSADDNEEVVEGDFVNKTGKCEVFKYFDDWYLFIRANQNPPETQCIYYTNRDFCNLLKTSSHFVSGTQGYRFSDTFFQTGPRSFYQKMLATIKRNSVMCQSSLATTASPQKIQMNPTYQRANNYYANQGQVLSSQEAEREIERFLRFHYRISVGRENVENLEKTVAAQVDQYFPRLADSEAIFNALIVEAWRWFRVLGQAETWNEETIIEKLSDFRTRFLALPLEVGRSLSEVSREVKKVSSKIERKADLLNEVKSSVEGQEKIVVFEGKSGIGKTFLMTDYLLNTTSLKIGEFLYFNSFEDFVNGCKKLLKIESLKVFIIDDIREDSQELQTAISTIKNTTKRLILLSRVSIANIASKEIKSLSRQEIKSYLDRIGKRGHLLNIAGRRLNLEAIAESGRSGLFVRMRNPEGLKTLCDLSIPEGEIIPASTSLLTSPYVSHAQGNFRPVPLNAFRVLPLYSLEEMSKLGEFTGSKWVKTTVDDNVIKFFRNPIAGNATFEILDLSLINLPDDLYVNLKSLLLDKIIEDRKKEKFKRDELILLLFDKEKKLDTWPEATLHALMALPQVVVFSERNMEKIAVHAFVLRRQESDYYFEYNTQTVKRLPPGFAQIKKPTESTIQDTVVQDQKNPHGALIVAEAGAGKSTTLKLLHQSHVSSTSLLWAEQYHHLVYVPLSQLANLGLDTLLAVCAYFLNIQNEIIKKALEFDLSKGKVLFLLDAWDELNSVERARLKALLSLFEQYQNILVTTRFTDQKNLFFNPVGIYELQRFSEDQVHTCIKLYFQSENYPEVAKSFSEQAIQFLTNPANKKALEIIGLPLQCYLLCEAWHPAFEASCQNAKIDMPWNRGPVLSQIELYQLFILSRLRKLFTDQYDMKKMGALISSEEVYSLSKEYLLALQNAAYQQLFRGKALKLGDDWFSKNLQRLGLINSTEFTHKTYAEYFTALYLVNLFINNPRLAHELINKYRYQAHYHLIFEFMAGIVSYGDPAIPSAKRYLREFWVSLLQEPRDCVGMADRVLVEKCYRQSNKTALASVFPAEAHRDIEKNLMNQALNSNLENEKQEGKKQEEAVPSLLTNSDDSESTSHLVEDDMSPNEKFVSPSEYGKWKNQEALIDVLPVAKYNNEEKQKALIWLVNRTKTAHDNGKEIYIIQRACKAKISALLKMIGEENLSELIKFFNEKELTTNSDLREMIIQSLIILEINLCGVDINNEIFLEIILDSEGNFRSFSDTELRWLSHHYFSDPRLEILLENLHKASFSVQQAVIKDLVSYGGDVNLSRLQIFLKNVKTLSLYLCIQYHLLQSGKISVEAYFEDVLSIKYDKDNDSFFMLYGLLESTRELFKAKSVSERVKALWISKIYEFAINTIKHSKHKNAIKILVIELVYLQLDSQKMEELLSSFLSRGADDGFWDEDAVMPCLVHLIPYFSQTYADYLLYKVCHAKYKKSLPTLIPYDFLETLPTEEARKIFIRACIQIFLNCFYYKGDSLIRNDAVNFVIRCEPNLLLPLILEDLNEVTVSFLQKYLTLNSYALTIQDGKIQLYTPGRCDESEITEENRIQLLGMKRAEELFFPEGVKKKAHSRSPSPVEFLIQYPGALLSKKSSPFTQVSAEKGRDNKGEQGGVEFSKLNK